jgi:hypothetical protein
MIQWRAQLKILFKLNYTNMDKRLSIYKLHNHSGYTTIPTTDGAGVMVPVVMMVEGVHNGSGGALYYSPEVLGSNISDWEGKPVVIEHPKDGAGTFISAEGLPAVGEVRNARMDDGKLKADAYLSYDQLKVLSQETLDRINANAPLEVSVGTFSSREDTPGDWNGEDYTGSVLDMLPDHLALLPNEPGACSNDDGCGIRVNSNSNSNKSKQGGGLKNQMSKKDLTKVLFFSLVGNETGFRETAGLIQGGLDLLDNGQKSHYLEEVYDGFYVYQVSSHSPNSRAYLKQAYSLNDNGEIELGSDPVPVKRTVTFDALSEGGGEEDEIILKRKTIMNRKGKATSCSIDALIANENSHFVEEDREFLANCTQEKLDSFIPVEATPAKEKAPVVNAEEPTAIAKGVADYLTANADAVMNALPQEVRDSIAESQEIVANQKAGLIAEIVANTKFTEDALKAWSLDHLTTLASSIEENAVPEGNFLALGSSRGGASDAEDDHEDAMSMINIRPLKEEVKKEAV